MTMSTQTTFTDSSVASGSVRWLPSALAERDGRCLVSRSAPSGRCATLYSPSPRGPRTPPRRSCQCITSAITMGNARTFTWVYTSLKTFHTFKVNCFGGSKIPAYRLYPHAAFTQTACAFINDRTHCTYLPSTYTRTHKRTHASMHAHIQTHNYAQVHTQICE